MEDDVVEMPMFPLGSPLLPHQLLPLQVFEPRYVQMFRADVVDAGDSFGAVMIERGSEVGGGDQRAEIGCMARVVEIRREESGKAVLLAVGGDRIRIARWLGDDPYPRAEVEKLPESPWEVSDDEFLERLTTEVTSVASLACELGGPPVPAGLEFSSHPVDRLWQLCLVSPLGALDRYQLLCEPSCEARSSLLREMLAVQRELLEARLGSP